MIEPKLKKKNLINRIIKKQLFITLSTAFLLVFILVGSSYAILNGKTETGVTDVIVQSGNLVASIRTEEDEIIEMNYTTLGVSNEVGLTYDPYTFSVENTGETTIAYYELRIVDKEYELSNLPHKSINYALSKDGGDYTEPQNLGDNKSYIYVGGPIAPGESDDFNLKMWVNEEFGKYANNKNLKAAIELTLYSDVPTRNYIIYDTQGGSYIPKTNVSSKRVTNQVPLKQGYSFIGWSGTPNGNVFYEQNAKYESSIGTTLYAKYEEAILITYNLNGGTGNIAPNDIKLGITTKVPTKAGFTFLGWATTENATTAQYEGGDAYDGEEAITLYAVWVAPDNEGPICVLTGSFCKTGEVNGNKAGGIFLSCTDESVFYDSDIAVSDIEISNESPVEVYEIIKSQISNGFQYNINFYINGSGSYLVNLRSNVISDVYDNGNDSYIQNASISCNTYIGGGN